MKKILILSVALFFIGCSVEQRNLNKAKKLVEAYMINNTPSDAEYTPIAYTGLSPFLSCPQLEADYGKIRDVYIQRIEDVLENARKILDETNSMKAYEEEQGKTDILLKELSEKHSELLKDTVKYKFEITSYFIEHKFKSNKYERGYAFAQFLFDKDISRIEKVDFNDENASEVASWVRDSIQKYLYRKDVLTEKEKKKLKKWEDRLEFIMK